MKFGILVLIGILTLLMTCAHASLSVVWNNGNVTIAETGISSQSLGYAQNAIIGINSVTITNISSNNIVYNQQTGSAKITSPPDDYPSHQSVSCQNGQSPININNVTVTCPSAISASKTFNSSMAVQSGSLALGNNITLSYSILPLPKINKNYFCGNGQAPIVNTNYNFSVTCAAAVSNSLIILPSNSIQHFLVKPENNVTFNVTEEPIVQSNTIVRLASNQSKRDNISGVTYVAAASSLLEGHYNLSFGECLTLNNTNITVCSPNQGKANFFEKLPLDGRYRNNQTNTTILAPNVSDIIDNRTNSELLFDAVAEIGCVPGGNVTFYDNFTHEPISICEEFTNASLDNPFLTNYEVSLHVGGNILLGIGQGDAAVYTAANENASNWKNQYNACQSGQSYTTNLLTSCRQNYTALNDATKSANGIIVPIGIVIIVALIVVLVALVLKKGGGTIQFRGGGANSAPKK